ncbi:MAG: DNA repair protein RecN [Gammaproteobacteria bacterium]|nr:DNA repair protein RecN [Gammaproteobacteria bacterium]
MLESIVISNFAIIDRVHIEFNKGMTALTGETGAGKSILLDAIQLVLGDRADSDCVKAGSDKADISVSFDTTQHVEAQQWLEQFELADADECLLRRVVQASGRSKAFINGSPVTLTQLKALGEKLVDVHGQHEHQSLQKKSVQRQLLDASLPDSSLLKETQTKFSEWNALKKQQQQVQDQSLEKEQRIDLLKLYTQEFEELSLQDNEVISLQEEYSRLSHAGQIIETSSSVLSSLFENDDTNIQQQLSHCVQQMESLKNLDASLNDTTDMVKSALIQIQEASSELRNYQDNIDIDPNRLDWLNNRLSQTQGLARKHQIGVEELVNYAASLKQELNLLLLDEEDVEKLQQQLEQAAEKYLVTAKKLSELRSNTAMTLSGQITEVMQTLGMQGGQFEIQVQNLQLQSQSDTPTFTNYGIDQIQFMVSANPGQSVKALNKVASGGELSRISLAIQVILSESSPIPTLIFDEVDSGIGGGIAEIVGRKLRQIAANRQVFCVTHLPQVASQAHQHLQVNKTKTDIETSTDVVNLDQNQRLEEIARMLGGMTITDQTRAHAQEMINNV